MRRLITRLAYPGFKCEDCISMKQYGCYCLAVGCYGPCDLRGRWYNRAANWLYQILYARDREWKK